MVGAKRTFSKRRFSLLLGHTNHGMTIAFFQNFCLITVIRGTKGRTCVYTGRGKEGAKGGCQLIWLQLQL
jgi:hypothetical protein